MPTILYIFVTTNRADQYLNPIIFTVDNRNVKKVVFVEIIKQNGQQVKAEKILKNVYDFARHLTEGYYLKHKPQKSISLIEFYNSSELERIKSLYKKCLMDKITWDKLEIYETDLYTFIISLSKAKEDLIIDLTCVSKPYLADVFSCCLLNKIDRVFTFDLIIEPNFNEPWKMLFHELEEGTDFLYINLTKTSNINQVSKLISFRTFPRILVIILTGILVVIVLLLNFWLGNQSIVIQILNLIATVFTILSYLLLFIPQRK